MKPIVKYHIRKLTVLVAGEKQLFQIKLPRNAKKITGILVTVKPYQRIKGRPKEPPIFEPPIKRPFPIKLPVKAELALADNKKVEESKAFEESKSVEASKSITVSKQPLIPIEHAI